MISSILSLQVSSRTKPQEQEGSRCDNLEPCNFKKERIIYKVEM
jgi:hypothetical protein